LNVVVAYVGCVPRPGTAPLLNCGEARPFALHSSTAKCNTQGCAMTAVAECAAMSHAPHVVFHKKPFGQRAWALCRICVGILMNLGAHETSRFTRWCLWR